MFTPRENPHEKSCKHCTLQQLGEEKKKRVYVPSRLFTCILLMDSQPTPSGLKRKNDSPGHDKQQRRRKL